MQLNFFSPLAQPWKTTEWKWRQRLCQTPSSKWKQSMLWWQSSQHNSPICTTTIPLHTLPPANQAQTLFEIVCSVQQLIDSMQSTTEKAACLASHSTLLMTRLWTGEELPATLLLSHTHTLLICLALHFQLSDLMLQCHMVDLTRGPIVASMSSPYYHLCIGCLERNWSGVVKYTLSIICGNAPEKAAISLLGHLLNNDLEHLIDWCFLFGNFFTALTITYMQLTLVRVRFFVVVVSAILNFSLIQTSVIQTN